MREKALVRGERERARSGILLCAPLGLKVPRGRYKVPVGSSTMCKRICSGGTTSRGAPDRGTIAGDAQRRRGIDAVPRTYGPWPRGL